MGSRGVIKIPSSSSSSCCSSAASCSSLHSSNNNRMQEAQHDKEGKGDIEESLGRSLPPQPSLSSFADALEYHHRHNKQQQQRQQHQQQQRQHSNSKLSWRTESTETENDESNNGSQRTTTATATTTTTHQHQHQQNEEQHIILHLLLFMKNRSWKKKVMMIIVILSVLVVLYDFLTNGYIESGIHTFLQWMEQHVFLGFFAFIFLFILATLAFVPPAILTFGSGFVFSGALGMGWGIFVATIASFVGASLGAIIAFLRARYMMRDLIKLFARRYPIVKAIDKAIKRKGLRVMLLLRLCPLIPFNGMNYIGGITGVKWHVYTISLVGSFPTIFLTVLIGATAGSLADNQGNRNQKVAQIISMTLGCILGLISVIFIWYYAKREIEKEINDQQRQQRQQNDQQQTTSSTASCNRSIERSYDDDIDTDDDTFSQSSMAVHEGEYQEMLIHDEEWFWVWS